MRVHGVNDGDGHVQLLGARKQGIVAKQGDLATRSAVAFHAVDGRRDDHQLAGVCPAEPDDVGGQGFAMQAHTTGDALLGRDKIEPPGGTQELGPGLFVGG